MANRDKKTRRRRQHSSRYNRLEREQTKPAVSTKNKKSSFFDFFPVLLLVGVVALGFYFFNGPSKQEWPASSLDQSGTLLTIEERIKRKEASLKLQKDIQKQDVLSEKFKKPVEHIDPLEPDVSSLDMGVRFSDDPSAQSVLKDLDEKPFENDMYKEPENIIRRQIAHKDWLRKHLERRNEEEKKKFIADFVKTAREQGYNVYFTKDMKAILEPIDPEEQKTDDPDFEEVQINWK